MGFPTENTRIWGFSHFSFETEVGEHTDSVDRFSERNETKRVVEDPATVEDWRREAEHVLELLLERAQRRADRVVGLLEQVVLAKRKHWHERRSETRLAMT